MLRYGRCGSTRNATFWRRNAAVPNASSHRDRARLQLILRGKRFGFTLSEIGEMLDLYDTSGGELKQLHWVMPKLEAQIGVLQKERAELADTIAELEITCGQLSETF